MIEHPVPQNITSYEFRLIGNMTIKQFLLLLAGGGLGFMFYSFNLPAIMKWPLAFISVVSGIGMAFIPYEERSMDQWFVNFIRAIYRPTKYYWRRVPKPPAFFSYTAIQSAMDESQRPDMTPYRQTRVKEFLSSLGGSADAAAADPLDMLGKSQDLTSLFAQVQAAADVTPGRQMAVQKPSLQTRPRPLGSKAEILFTTTQSSSTTAPPSPVITTTTQAVAPPTTAFTPQPVLTVESAEPEKKKEEAAPTKQGEVEIAPLKTVSVQAEDKKEEEAPAVVPAAAPTEAPSAYLEASSLDGQAHGEQVIPAVFDRNLPFPASAEKPNVLIGMVHNQAKGIIPGAIVEIVDASGNTVRAMKTNNLGQFYMSSPLANGVYSIHTDKDGATFPIYQFETTGAALDPVDITATG